MIDCGVADCVPYITNTTHILHQALENKEGYLLEGAQGACWILTTVTTRLSHHHRQRPEVPAPDQGFLPQH